MKIIHDQIPKSAQIWLIFIILQLIDLFLILEKFIPFKTPLDDKYKALIPPADLFTPQMLIKSIASYKVINQIQSNI